MSSYRGLPDTTQRRRGDLAEYYARSAITPGICACRGQAGAYMGAQSHVGLEYDLLDVRTGLPLRLVVVARDQGDSPADTMDEQRTKILSWADGNAKTPQPCGTVQTLLLFFGVSLSEIPQGRGCRTKVFRHPLVRTILDRFAMPNSLKCSDGVHTGNRPPWLVRECSKRLRGELEVLDPTVIITQGDDAFAALHSCACLQPVRGDGEFFECVVNRAQPAVPLIRGPHPAARGGQWQAFFGNRLTALFERAKGSQAGQRWKALSGYAASPPPPR